MNALRNARGGTGARATALSAPFLSTVVISFFFILGVSIVVPVLPLVVEDYGITRAEGGLLLSSFALGRLGFDLVAGLLGDRFGIRRVALVACLITVVASLLAALTPSYGLMLAARVAQGAGSALYMTVAMSHVIDMAPEGHVGRLLAIYQGVILAGVSFGPTAGGIVTQVWGVPGPFVLYAGFGVIGAIVALRWMPQRATVEVAPAAGPDGQPLRRRSAMRALLTTPTFLLVLLAAFTVFAVRSGMGSTLLPLVAAEDWGFSQAAIGVLLTVSALGNLAVLAHAGRTVDRSRRRTLQLGLWASVPVAIVAAFVISPWMLFLAAAWLGAAKGYAGVVPGAVLADLAAPRVRSTAVGVQRTATDLGLLVGPVTAGALADGFGFTWAFLASGAFLAVVAIAASFMRETAPGVAAAPAEAPEPVLVR